MLSLESLLLFSCFFGKLHQPRKAPQALDPEAVSSLKKRDSPKAEAGSDSAVKALVAPISIKDEPLYSKAFVKDIKSLGYPTPIQVIGNFVLAEGNTINLQEDLKLNEAYAIRPVNAVYPGLGGQVRQFIFY